MKLIKYNSVRKTVPTQKYLSECFTYDPETGNLFWKARPRKHFKSDSARRMHATRYAGKLAGSIKTERNGKKYRYILGIGAARVIWILTKGENPEEIDHENGAGLDNRWCNLRNVSGKENSKNKRLQSNNTSGHAGVYAAGPYWYSSIRVDKKPFYLGYFKTKKEAIAVRKAAEVKHGFHQNHGQSRPL